MDTRNIEQILTKDSFTRHVFQGVYPVDCLPERIDSYPTAIICNTDPSDRPGAHWVAMYFDDAMCGEFFDSFGFHPSYHHENFTRFMNKHSIRWTYNMNQLQSVLATTCGQFCVFYLLHRCRRVDLSKIVHMFTNDKHLNDVLVNDFISDNYSFSYPIVDVTLLHRY
jgi:hypothetical protein